MTYSLLVIFLVSAVGFVMVYRRTIELANSIAPLIQPVGMEEHRETIEKNTAEFP